MSACPHGYGMRDHCASCRSFDHFNVRDFAWALRQLRDGLRVRRNAWRDLDTCLVLIERKAWSPKAMDWETYEHTGGAFIVVSSASDDAMPWGPSQSDILASDWAVSK